MELVSVAVKEPPGLGFDLSPSCDYKCARIPGQWRERGREINQPTDRPINDGRKGWGEMIGVHSAPR